MSSSGNRRYLREHPELKAITTWFISEIIYTQPPDILQFAASFFRSRVMQNYVAQSLGYQSKDSHVAILRATALNTISSSAEPSEDVADASDVSTRTRQKGHRSTGSSSRTSIRSAYRCLLNLSEKLGDARRCGGFSTNASSDNDSLPEELSSNVLTNDVKEILSNMDGLNKYILTLPETLSNRRAACLLQNITGTFKLSTEDESETHRTDSIQQTTIPPVTLTSLLPLVDNKLWGSLYDSEQQGLHSLTYELKLPDHSLEDNITFTTETSFTSKQASNYHMPGLFVGCNDSELFNNLKNSSSIHNFIVTEDIAFQFPNLQADCTNSKNDYPFINFAEYKVTASKSFMSNFLSDYNKINEISTGPLDSSFFTTPGILVQHTLCHFLSCPILVPITVHLRSLLTSCLFISRGGLLQWDALLDFSDHEFKPSSITSILNTSLLTSTIFKASLGQSKNQSIIKSTIQTDTQLNNISSSLPIITASGKLKFSEMLAKMDNCSLDTSINDQSDNDEESNKKNESIDLNAFVTVSNPSIAHSPKQQEHINLLYEEINPDLLTFFRSVAPHISGIGVEEYSYGILDICTFLPNTYFCCANLEIGEKSGNSTMEKAMFKGMPLDANDVYVGCLFPSLPLRYLFSVNSIFPELGYGHFRIFKYLPIIVRGSYPHEGLNNVCIVFTSILPTTHCDNIIPGRSILNNLKRKGSSNPVSNYYNFYALPPSARLLENINTEVHKMLEKAEIQVSVVRYILLSSTTSYGRGALVLEDTGNFLSNSWINTYIFPSKVIPNYTSQNVLSFHEFMNYAYRSDEYSQLLQQPYDYNDPQSVDISVAIFYSLLDMTEENYVGAVPLRVFPNTVGSSSLSKPYKRLLQTKVITTQSYINYMTQLQPLQKFVQRNVMAKFPLILNKILYYDLLSCKILPWLGPVEYVSFLAKTVHTPLLCYLAHKIRDCACYYLPIISSHRRELLATIDKEGTETEHMDIIAGLTTATMSKLNNRMTDQKLHPSASIDLIACFSARILAGGTPSYEANDVHHDSMNCSKSCSTAVIKSRIYQSRSIIYPDNTVSSLIATFPSLFSTEAQLYLTRLTLSQLLDALCYTYSSAFNSGQRSVHVVCDSLPYLTNIGLYYDASKESSTGSFLFNLEKLSYDLVSQFKYSVAKDTIVSKIEENYALLEKNHILELVYKHRIPSEDMEKEVLLLTDKHMFTSPIGIARKLSVDAPGWRWDPMIIPLRRRHYNQIKECYEFDDTKVPINLHLTAGHALVGRYYPGLDPERGIYAMEDHMRRAIYSIPFSIVCSSGTSGIPSMPSVGTWRHLLELIH